MPTTTEPFSLQPDREAALWEAVEHLGLDPQASALTLVRGVLTLGLDPHRQDAFSAACELRHHLDRGRPVEFRQRPIPLPILGPDDPLRPGGEVMPDAC